MARHPFGWLKAHTVDALADVPENVTWLSRKARADTGQGRRRGDRGR